jgi:hypothetical protein
LTKASLVMLPWYLILNAAYAVNFYFDPFGRNALAPTLTYHRHLFSGDLHPWGIMFGLCTILLLVGIVTRSRLSASFACAMSFMAWLMWTWLTLRSTLIDTQTSAVAPFLSATVAVACLATTISLWRGET